MFIISIFFTITITRVSSLKCPFGCYCMDDTPYLLVICENDDLTDTFTIKWENITQLEIQAHKTKRLRNSTFRNLPQLTHLTIDAKHLRFIDEIAFQDLPFLRELYIKHTLMKEIDMNLFLMQTMLETLRLEYNNEMTSLDFSTSSISKSLKTLVIIEERSLVSESVIKHLQNLEELKIIGKNDYLVNINNSTFSSLKKLKILHLQSNGITSIHKNSFYHMNGLENLTISNNLIGQINDELFRNLTKLKSLDISHNRISIISTDAFFSQHNLHKLNLRSNLIVFLDGDLFTKTKRLQLLKLNNNRIQSLPTRIFHDMKKLTFIQLQSNKITKINKETFKNLKHLKFLSLKDNNLHFLHKTLFSDLKDLLTLNLENNNLSSIHRDLFAEQKELTTLHLAKNKLTKFEKGTFSSLLKLRKLNLRNNLFQQFPKDLFWNLTELNFLHLSHNRLTNIEGPLFQESNDLAILFMDNNELTEINQYILQHLKLVYVLEFMNNKIKTIHPAALNDLKDVSKLTFQNNRLRCSCYLAILFEYHANKTFLGDCTSRNGVRLLISQLSCGFLTKNWFYHKKWRKIEQVSASVVKFSVGTEFIVEFELKTVLNEETNVFVNIENHFSQSNTSNVSSPASHSATFYLSNDDFDSSSNSSKSSSTFYEIEGIEIKIINCTFEISINGTSTIGTLKQNSKTIQQSGWQIIKILQEKEDVFRRISVVINGQVVESNLRLRYEEPDDAFVVIKHNMSVNDLRGLRVITNRKFLSRGIMVSSTDLLISFCLIWTLYSLF